MVPFFGCHFTICWVLVGTPCKIAGISGLSLDLSPVTPPKSNIAPENQWLEDKISFDTGPIAGAMLVYQRGKPCTMFLEPAKYETPVEPRKKPSYFPLYWLFDRDPYNGVL